MTVAVTIDRVASSLPWYITRSHSRSLVWTADDVGYLFYRNELSSGAQLTYTKTTDAGVNWSTPVHVCNVSAGFDIWYSKWTDTSFTAYIHIFCHDDSSSTRGVRYQRLNPADDTLLYSEDGTVLATVGVNPYSSIVSCCVARSGAVHCFGPTVHKVSADSGATFTDGDGTLGQATLDSGYLFPDQSSADTADMLMIWHDNSAALAKVSQYDASSTAWGSATTIGPFNGAGDVLTSRLNLSGTYNRANGHVYIALYPVDQFDGSESNNEESAALNLVTYDVYGVTVTATTNVLTNVQFCSGVALVRFSTGVVRCYYARDADNLGYKSEQLVYYKESSDAMVTWGAEQSYSTAPEASIVEIIADPAPAHDDENGAAYQFSLYEPSPYSSQLWYEIVLDSGTPTPPADYPMIFKCQAVDGVGVVTFVTDSHYRTTGS